MSTSSQAICASFDHNWTAWGLFEHVLPMMKVTCRPTDPVPEKEPMIAYRWRECRRCGARQREHFGTGKREIIDEN
jgi:hypothetical protein